MSARTALDEMSKDGDFKRKDAAWRNWISRGKEEKDTFRFCVARKTVSHMSNLSCTVQQRREPSFLQKRIATIYLLRMRVLGHTERSSHEL